MPVKAERSQLPSHSDWHLRIGASYLLGVRVRVWVRVRVRVWVRVRVRVG